MDLWGKKNISCEFIFLNFNFNSIFLSYFIDFFNTINESGAYNDDVVNTLREAIEKFKATQTY